MTDPIYTIRHGNVAYPRHQFQTTGNSLTIQSHKDECDINRIMAKWQKTGILEHRNNFEGQYGDFTNTPGDYQASMNAVLNANDMFASLPSKIRRRFGNDPGQFLDFANDPDNEKEMVVLGLSKAPPAPPKAPPEPTPPKPKTPPKGETLDPAPE